MNKILIFLICSLISLTCCQKQQGQDKGIGFFLERLNGEDVWLHPIDGEQTYLASSFQLEEPRDCNNFLRTEEDSGKEWKVLVDLQGSGIMTRFWLANRNASLEGDLEIYIDDSLVVKTTLSSFFSGEQYPYLSPLVVSEKQSSGGRISYFPVPFNSNLKVRSNSESNSFYWQINYSLFDDENIKGFTGKLSGQEDMVLKKALEKFENTDNTKPGTIKTSDQLQIAGGDSVTKTIQGCGTINEIQLQLSGDQIKITKDIQLEVYYGENSEPAIDAGILELLNANSKIKDYESKYMSIDGGLLTFKIPIPFDKGLIIKLINKGENDLNGLVLNLSYIEECESTMKLHAFTNFFETLYGDTLELASVNGKGVFIGFNLTTAAPAGQKPDFFNQEGNEYIIVDDSLVWKGTGTEDYFNSGYYYTYGEMALPLHGCLQRDTINGGIISTYRIHKLDAVKFDHNLQVLLEAGCPKKGAPSRSNANHNIPLFYESTVLFYKQE